MAENSDEAGAYPQRSGDSDATTEMAEQSSPHQHAAKVTSWAINTLAILALFGTFYLARALVLPLVLSLLLALLLTPLVTWLNRLYLPRPLGAGIVVLTLGGALVYGSYVLSGQASVWVEQLPNAISSLRAELAPITDEVENFSDAAEKVDELTGDDKENARQPTRFVQVEGGDLRDAFLAQAQAFILGTLVLLFLLYFLLAGSERIRRNTLDALPDLTSERRVLAILARMQRQISRYLITITLINTALGSTIAAIAWFYGLPNPILWGAMAGLLNFVPYIGPAASMLVLVAVSVTSLSGTAALAVPAIFAVLTSLEGQLITPTILGRNLALNPIFIFISLIFWGWLWGIIGALLAVPIMVSIKIVCDTIPPLQPYGTVLGR